MRSRIGHHIMFLARFPGKRRAPLRVLKEWLEPKACQSHAHQVSDQQKDKIVAVKERNRSPLNNFRSLSRKMKVPYKAPKEQLKPKAHQSDARQVSGRKKDKLMGVEEPDWSPHNVFSSLSRQTKGPIKSIEGMTQTQIPSNSFPPSERPTKRRGSGSEGEELVTA